MGKPKVQTFTKEDFESMREVMGQSITPTTIIMHLVDAEKLGIKREDLVADVVDGEPMLVLKSQKKDFASPRPARKHEL